MAQKPYQEVREYPLPASQMLECSAITLNRIGASIKGKDPGTGLIEAITVKNTGLQTWRKRVTVTVVPGDEGQTVLTVSILELSAIGIAARIGYSDKRRKPAADQFFTTLARVLKELEEAGGDLSQLLAKSTSSAGEGKSAELRSNAAPFDQRALGMGIAVSAAVRVALWVLWVAIPFYQTFGMDVQGETLTMMAIGGATVLLGALAAGWVKRHHAAALEGLAIAVAGGVLTNWCGSLVAFHTYHLTFVGWMAYIQAGLLGGWLGALASRRRSRQT
jgi:hypothetical protein